MEVLPRPHVLHSHRVSVTGGLYPGYHTLELGALEGTVAKMPKLGPPVV